MLRSLKTLSRCLHIKSSPNAHPNTSGKVLQNGPTPAQNNVGGERDTWGKHIRLKKVEHEEATSPSDSFSNSRTSWPRTEHGEISLRHATPAETQVNKEEARTATWKNYQETKISSYVGQTEATQPTVQRPRIITHEVNFGSKLVRRVEIDETKRQVRPLIRSRPVDMKVHEMPSGPTARELAMHKKAKDLERQQRPIRHSRALMSDKHIPPDLVSMPQTPAARRATEQEARRTEMQQRSKRHLESAMSDERAQQDLSKMFDELLRAEATRQSPKPQAERHVPRLAFDTNLSSPHRDGANVDGEMQAGVRGETGRDPDLELNLPSYSKPAVEKEESPSIQDQEREMGELGRYYNGLPETKMRENLAFRDHEMEQDAMFQGLDSACGPSEIDAKPKLAEEIKDRRGVEANTDVGTRQELGLLVLRSASKLLDQSDFTSLEPSAKHLEGWSNQGKILKIVRGRDENTLVRNGSYYLVFASQDSAKAYLDRVSKIHHFAGRFVRRDLESPLPPQPSAFDISHPGRMLDAYALGLPGRRRPLNLTLWPQPWPPLVRSILEQSGYASLVRGRLSQHEVLLSVEGTLLFEKALGKCIVRDAQQRRIQWATVGDPWQALRSFELNGFGGEPAQGDQGLLVSSPEYLHRRFVVSLESHAEALRFVMSWHRRDIKDLIEGFTGEKAVVNAELTS